MKGNKIYIEITAEVRDSHGSLVCRKMQEANSLVKGFLDLMYVMMYGGNLISAQRIDGQVIAAVPRPDTFRSVSPAGGLIGIVPGSGSRPVAITDYALQTIIPHGNTAGLLQYGTGTITTPGTTGGMQSMQISRSFANGGPTAVVIQEVGIYSAGNTTDHLMCIDRTLMNIDVAPGATAVITYTIQISV